ncbi:MAG: Ig-like domain-containing protein [Piscinibacter sp.]
MGDSATTTEDSALTIAAATLLANDSDVDGDTLSIVSVQGAVNGTVALVGGDVVFTPAPGYNGPASFSYTVSDGRGGSAIATVNLTVAPDNDAPVAVGDIVGPVNEDNALTIAPATLLGNDSDPDGDTLSITSVQGAVNGTVALVGGNVVFTPAANYNGPASFTYTVSDGNGGSSTATVNLTVNPVNDAPVANADFLTTAEDTPVVVSLPALVANDTDVDGDTLVVFSAGSVSHGSLSLVGGNLVFTPDANYNGPASFTYGIHDGHGGVAYATVNINVTPVNDAPVASSSTITVAEESVNTPLGLSAPTDVDGDALTITVTGLPTVGTVTLADGTPVANGQVLTAAQLAGLQFDAPADLLAATSTSFSYSVNDGSVTVNASTTINVTPVNDAPVANADFLTTAEDTPVVISLPALVANDTDIDGDALFVFSAGNVTHGSLSFVGGNLVFTPDANYSGPASFSYGVHDGHGGVDFATVNINVTPVNDAPVASSSTITVAEESVNTPLGLSAPTDVDGDALTITVTGLPSVGTVTLADGTPVANGQVLTAAQLAGLQFDAPADLLAATSTSFSYSVNDGSVSVNASTTINVTPVNDAPVANNDVASTAINTPLASIPVLANDSDVDGDALTVTAATLANPALGSVSINPDGTLAFTPATNVSGPVLINYTISDGHGGSSSATLAVNVGANTPPTGADATVTIAEDGSRSFSAADFGFADADVGQTLAAVRIETLPAAGALTLGGVAVVAGQVINAADLGQLVFAPAPNASGTAYAGFTFSVQDSAGAFDSLPNTITVNVTPVPDVAVISGVASGNTVEDTTLSVGGQLLVSDPDPGEAAFQPQANAAGTYGSLSIDASGAWTYNLNNGDPVVQSLAQGETRTDTFTVQSIDGTPQLITITITGTNDAAVISAGTGSVTEDLAVVGGNIATGGTLSVTDVDAGQASFQAQASTAGAYGTFTLATNGAWTYTAANGNPAIQALGAGQTLTETFTVRSADGTTSSVVVTINGTNDVAVISAGTGSVTEDVAVDRRQHHHGRHAHRDRCGRGPG